MRDYGDLLTTSAKDLADKARRTQLSAQMVISGDFIPNQPVSATELEGYGARLLRDARDATREFRDGLGVREDWIADRIIGFRVNSDLIVQFAIASYRYRIKVREPDITRSGEMPADEINAYWRGERELRTALIAQVKVLALLHHPPRASVRIQILSAWRAIKARFKGKLPELPKGNAQAAGSVTGESAPNEASPAGSAEAASPSGPDISAGT